MGITEYTITELAVGIGTVISAISACLLICFKSRCKNVRICYGLIDCERQLEKDKKNNNNIEINNDIENNL